MGCFEPPEFTVKGIKGLPMIALWAISKKEVLPHFAQVPVKAEEEEGGGSVRHHQLADNVSWWRYINGNSLTN
jgi:hypothetical protein